MESTDLSYTGKKTKEIHPFFTDVYLKSDKIIEIFLLCYFIFGVLIAFRYDTWIVAIIVGGLNILCYYGAKILMPKNSRANQYVASAVVGIYTAQFIYQQHGMFEMHFFAFVGSTLMIIYQNWKALIPVSLVVAIHHGVFAILQFYYGYDWVNFSQVDFDIETYGYHIALAVLIFFICALWSRELEKHTIKNQKTDLIKQLNIGLQENAAQLKSKNEKLEDNNKMLNIAELSLKRLVQELKDRNKEAEQFSYVASHDLQEPLRTITNFMRLLEEKYTGKLDKEGHKYMGFILSSTTKMQNLIKDLLDFSKLGRNTVFSVVNCNGILKEVIADMAGTINESEAKITNSTLPELRGISIELKQLFQNLISNAIKFKKENSIVEISITAEEKETEYLFAVKDNGIGIEERFKDRIFIIFQRLHNVKEYPGTGIGLATCKKIVSLHNGNIWVESNLGGGSTFYFTISKEI